MAGVMETNIHNRCVVEMNRDKQHVCITHRVLVYRDGVDWLTMPGPQ